MAAKQQHPGEQNQILILIHCKAAPWTEWRGLKSSFPSLHDHNTEFYNAQDSASRTLLFNSRQLKQNKTKQATFWYYWLIEAAIHKIHLEIPVVFLVPGATNWNSRKEKTRRKQEQLAQSHTEGTEWKKNKYINSLLRNLFPYYHKFLKIINSLLRNLVLIK